MALTQGQIESFGLICYNQIACQYACYILQVRDGLSVYDQTTIEEKFFRANSMLAVIWGYDPQVTSNCLTVAQIESICWKLEETLNFSLELSTLPDTYLNQVHQFKWNEFAPYQFA